MIEALDHLILGAASIGDYETLLGRRVIDGKLRTGNVGLRFAGDAGGLSAMAFATADLDKASNLLQRRAVATTREGEAIALSAHGVTIKLAARTHEAPSPLAASDEASAVSALDHVVIRTPNPERAIAFYGGRLGLSLRLDRSNADWGQRLLFFRCGDLVVHNV